MKNILFIIIITALAIGLIISVVFAFNAQQYRNYETQLADQIFKSNLSKAQSGFSTSYDSLNDNERVSFYLQISSSLSTSINIIDLTSYNNIKNRNDLFSAIYNLYWCMNRSDSRKAILANNTIVYKYLTQIMLNPEDEKDCKALAKLAGDIYGKAKK